jgi:hypothetical protein
MNWTIRDRIVDIVDVAEVNSAAIFVPEAEALALADCSHLAGTHLRKPDVFIRIEDILRQVDEEQFEIEIEGHVGQGI